MTTFFTADTHFGHVALLRSRPFATIDEHDEALIARWNARVSLEEEVWHLGDFASGADRTRCAEIFARLNGVKRLVVGNHDSNRVLDLPWHDPPLERVRIAVPGPTGTERLYLSHYPMRSWPGVVRGVRHLFGHTHGTLSGTSLSCDVGADDWDYAPVTVEEVVARQRATPALPEELALLAAGRAALRHGGEG